MHFSKPTKMYVIPEHKYTEEFLQNIDSCPTSAISIEE